MSFKFNPFTGQLDVVDSASGGGSLNYIVEHRTITNTESINKELTLANVPPDPTLVTLDIINGTPQRYNDDYIVSGDRLIWNGYALDVTLEQGDKLRIIYPI